MRTRNNAYPEQDSNLHCPRPERGASCQLGYPGIGSSYRPSSQRPGSNRLPPLYESGAPPVVLRWRRRSSARSGLVGVRILGGIRTRTVGALNAVPLPLGHEDRSCWEPRNWWTRAATGSRTPVSAMARRRNDRCATATSPRSPRSAAEPSAGLEPAIPVVPGRGPTRRAKARRTASGADGARSRLPRPPGAAGGHRTRFLGVEDRCVRRVHHDRMQVLPELRRPCGVRTRNLSAENRVSCQLAPTVRGSDRQAVARLPRPDHPGAAHTIVPHRTASANPILTGCWNTCHPLLS